MAISPRYKLVFIHVPKTGGTSIEEFFRKHGGCLVVGNHKTLYHGHSIQHSTYQELKESGQIPKGYRIFTVIRHPYDRFLSDYNYYLTIDRYNGDIESFAVEFFNDPDGFDNHNKSITYFLSINGRISPQVRIIKIENLDRELRRRYGIILGEKMNVSTKFKTKLPQSVKEVIYENWKEDFKNFGFVS